MSCHDTSVIDIKLKLENGYEKERSKQIIKNYKIIDPIKVY